MADSRVLEERVIGGDDSQIRSELNSMIIGLKRKSRKPKKRILFLVDNHQWCWTTTARNIARNIPEYAFQIEPASEFKKYARQMVAMADMVYLRGYPFAFFDGLDFVINKPFIWTLSTGGENLDMRISQSIEYAARGAACIVQCERARKEAEAAGISNVHVIPNGVDLSLFKPSESAIGASKIADVGFAGNDEGARAHLKGVDFIRRACDDNGWTYAAVNKNNRLSYTEMPAFYNSVRIYAQPSDSEGCSNSVMEAMACGIPCLICEGVGYHGEQCRDGENVVFVERDSEDIASKIEWLLTDADAYRRISDNARQFAERHSWKEISAMHRDVISRAIESAANEPRKDDGPECCETCGYFTSLKEYHGSGICTAQCESIYFRHKKMFCEKFKTKKGEQ